ncbi:MAG TPA: 30S ribosomal protein S20 [Thermoanaerobaculia bacterium]|nr:30S ribosomal protein S20 [Thermoanaerobaculia bacterium]
MANIRSAEKQRRQAEKAKTRNRAGKTRLRSQIKQAREAIETGESDLQPILNETFSVIDRSARKKYIKENTADRYKSRLAAAAKRASAG